MIFDPLKQHLQPPFQVLLPAIQGAPTFLLYDPYQSFHIYVEINYEQENL